MLHWGLSPFMRPALALMLGVAAYEVGLRTRPAATVYLVSALLLTLLLCWVAGRKLSPASAWLKSALGIGLLLTWALAGALWAELANTSRQPTHLLHLPAPPRTWQGVVDEGFTRRATYAFTIVQVRRVRLADGTWHPATGRVRLSVRHEPNGRLPAYGDVLLVAGAPRPVGPPPNPGQFDFAAYLRHRQIWHEQYVSHAGFRVVGSQPRHVWVGTCLRVADQLQQVLRRYVLTHREASLLVALVLGITDDLDPDLKLAYGATGTTHVLAVSGLHIGLVFGTIVLLLGGSRWHRRPWPYRLITLLIVLAVIWSYALLTGLSASVMRAVVMSTLVATGRALGRRISLYNTLAVAALVLLLGNPDSLFDVGFQLSFLAVLSIAYLQPRIARLWHPEGWVPRTLWQAVAIALAAQIGTAPLTLYYFHQFPVQFLLANLIAVPWSNGLLYGSFLLLFLAGMKACLAALGLNGPAGVLSAALAHWGHLLSLLTTGLNQCMVAIGHLPAAVISGIWITGLQLALLYAILILTLGWLSTRRREWLIGATLLVACYVGCRLDTTRRTGASKLVAIYAVRHHSALGLLDGTRATVLTDSAVWRDSLASAGGLRANVLPHLWQRGTDAVRWRPLPAATPLAPSLSGVVVRHLPDGNRLLAWRNTRLLLVDHPLQLRPRPGTGPLRVDYVIVRGRPWLPAAALARAVACRVVVLDGSGPAGWSRWRRQELLRAGFRCHDVARQGAFVRQL